MGCKFSIGQKIIAIRDHSLKDFLKDQEFVVLDIEYLCGDWIIKIHEGNTPIFIRCKHGSDYLFNGRFYDQRSFAPLPEVGEMTFEEALGMVEPKTEKI